MRNYSWSSEEDKQLKQIVMYIFIFNIKTPLIDKGSIERD